jgi:hypothetical protein
MASQGHTISGERFVHHHQDQPLARTAAATRGQVRKGQQEARTFKASRLRGINKIQNDREALPSPRRVPSGCRSSLTPWSGESEGQSRDLVGGETPRLGTHPGRTEARRDSRTRGLAVFGNILGYQVARPFGQNLAKI